MKYIVYKITNNINGKIYIGCHKTSNIEDDYMGSGKYLKHAILKYGLENFTKEILHIFDNPYEMFEKELEIVNIDFVIREDTYNIKIGGKGGWDHIDHSSRNKRINQNRDYSDPEYRKKLSEKTKESMKVRMLNGEKPWGGKNRGGKPKGWKHTDETKEKISQSAKTQPRRMWIHNLDLKKSKMIEPQYLQEFLDQNWKVGNKRKF